MQRIQQLLQHPRSVLWLWLSGMGLLLPSLAAGLFADDFTHAVLINAPGLIQQSDPLSLFHLFSFLDADPERRLQLYGQNLIPWWTNPEFILQFWRPLAELTHYLDYHWLQRPWLMHLHSLCWYGLLLMLLAQFYQRFCRNRQVALWALLFFVVDGTHSFTVAWLANRNAVMAAVFTVAAVLLHDNYRKNQRVSYMLYSLLAIMASFLSAEIGVSVGAFLLIYALFYDRAAVHKALLHLLPALLLFLLWWGVYHHFGYGAAGNKAYYASPLQNPVYYWQNFALRFPAALAVQFNPIPIHLIKTLPITMALLGTGFLLLISYWIYRLQQQYLIAFWLLLLLLIVPLTAAEVLDRNLLIVNIAGAVLLAEMLLYLQRSRLHYARPLALLLVVAHVWLSIPQALGMAYLPKLLAKPSQSLAASLPAEAEGQRVITLGLPVFDAVYQSQIRWVNGNIMPECYWNLVSHNSGLTVRRRDESSLILSNPDGLLTDMDVLLRDVTLKPFTIGKVINLNGIRVSVQQVNIQQQPTRLLVKTDQALPQLYYLERERIPLKYYGARVKQRLQPLQLAVGEQYTFE